MTANGGLFFPCADNDAALDGVLAIVVPLPAAIPVRVSGGLLIKAIPSLL